MPVAKTNTAPTLTDLLFEKADGGRCLVAPDGTVLRANAEWLRSTGFTEDQVVDENIIDLFPATRDMALAMHARARAGHRVEVPRHAQLVNGRETWWEGTIEPVPMEEGTGLLITARELAREPEQTASPEVDARQDERDARYHSLLTAIDEGFCVVEVLFDGEKPVDYRFLEVNPAFEKHTGIERAVGRRMREIAPAHEEHWFQVYGRVATTGEPVRFQLPADALGRYYDVYAFSVGDPRQRQVAILFSDITEHRRAEAALRESEERHRSVLENMAEGLVVFDAAGNITYENPASVRIHARQLSGDRGRLDQLVVNWRVREYPEGAVVPPEQWAIPRVLRGERIQQERFFVDCLEDPARNFVGIYNGCPVHDSEGRFAYGFLTIEEITEQARAEAEVRLRRYELEAEKARLQAIIGTIPVGLMMLDERGVVVLENDEWRRTWAGNGLREGSVVDYDSYKGFRQTGERIAGEEWPCALSLKNGVETRDVVLDIERFDGTRGTIVVCSAPIRDDGGRIVGAVAANMDITELRDAQARLQEADRRKDEFLAMLAHELRNPLAPIRNSSYILRHAAPNSEQARRSQEVIERQMQHLTRLVDDLLDVTRIARGKIELRRQRVDLREVVARAADDFRFKMDQNGVAFRIAAPDAQLWTDADPTRVAQVVGNLLHNAEKFTRRGDEVAVSLVAVERCAELRVRDTGAGIDPALLPQIFDPFVQGDQSLARTQGGLGLGLSLVKGIVALHGGSVRAESGGKGAGAEFVVRLPLAIEDAPTDDHPTTTPQLANRGRRVLVVDDNRDAAESLADLVRLLGHSAEVAYDGPSAVQRARANPPDIVLCDIGLPGMSGYEVAKALRASAPDSVQLIAVSGYAQPEDVRRAVEAGFDAHVAKPCAPEQIERLLA